MNQVSRQQVLLVAALVALLVGVAQFDSPAVKSFACNGTQMTEAEIATYRGISLETMHLLHRARGLTPESICAMPQAKLDRAIYRANNPKPDHPGEAVAFRNLQLQDENGYIPPDGLLVAKAQMDAMRASQEVGAAEAGITPGSWTWIGPGNIGGRIRAIVIHPTTPNTMWIGSVSGGIWKTTDGGASWSIQDDFMANMAVSTMIMDPTNSNTLYAGTGEGFYNADGIRGAGIFKTTNGGTAWTQLANTNNSSFYYVNRLAISPDGNTILAATRSGLWRSVDDGATWTQELVSSYPLDVNFHPTDSTKAIAGGWGGTAWYSTNGGDTWNTATFTGLVGADRVEVAYAPGSPTTVYASIEVNGGEIWKSTNGGQTYALVNTGDAYLGSQGWYDNIIWVDPTNANNVIVGGIDLYRSADGGSTLSPMSYWWMSPTSAHADHHMIIQHPDFNGTSNRTVFFGNDGGIYKATDYTTAGSTGWTELNNNLGITQFYGAAGNPTTGDIIGGTQDNGTLFYSGSTDWAETYGGDGGWSAADPTDPNYFYGEYIYLDIHRSEDGGASADYISGEYWTGSAWAWKSPPYRIEDAYNSNANFIAPFVLDPNNANRLLAGGLSLWQTNNVKAANTSTTGPSWAAIKSSAGSYISAIAVAPGNSDIIWVGHNNGNVYKTANGTAGSPAWSQVDTNSPGLPNRVATRITIDANDNNKVYVTFGGFSEDNVWRTTNGGSNWTDITGGTSPTGLPQLPARSLVIHPTNSNWLYVGTELGIFASEDGGTTWGLPHDGPTNTSVDELFWLNDTLVAATHGRGLFTVPVPGTCFTLTVAASPVGGGSVNASPPTNCSGGRYAENTVVQLTANASAGYAFLNWSGDAAGSTNPASVTMTADKAVTANFAAVPGAPTLLSPANNTLAASYTTALDWSDSSPALDHYWLQVDDNSNFSSPAINEPALAASTHTPGAPLASGTTYYWRVSAHNSNNQTLGWSSVFTFHTALVPPAPVMFAVNSLRPVFDWNNATGASSYTIQISANQNFTTLVTNFIVSPSAYVPTADLPRNTLLFWRVRANNTNGSSGWSRVRHFYSPNPPGAPTLVSPAAEAAVTSTPTLDWNDLSPAPSYYEVQIYTDSTFAVWLGRGRGGKVESSQYMPTTPLAAGAYQWRVRAVSYSADGLLVFGPWSASRSFVVGP